MRDRALSIILLELRSEVVGQLSETVVASVSNSRIGVITVLQCDVNNWADLQNILDILADLAKEQERYEEITLILPSLGYKNFRSF